mmetsp:Transcript_6092/g.15077  ORF Transcript_6092/g.15077 Transcript_6092/m.15077 type:complete len:221 (-) Transcript_6092:562-1224(-)
MPCLFNNGSMGSATQSPCAIKRMANRRSPCCKGSSSSRRRPLSKYSSVALTSLQSADMAASQHDRSATPEVRDSKHNAIKSLPRVNRSKAGCSKCPARAISSRRSNATSHKELRMESSLSIATLQMMPMTSARTFRATADAALWLAERSNAQLCRIRPLSINRLQQVLESLPDVMRNSKDTATGANHGHFSGCVADKGWAPPSPSTRVSKNPEPAKYDKT